MNGADPYSYLTGLPGSLGQFLQRVLGVTDKDINEVEAGRSTGQRSPAMSALGSGLSSVGRAAKEGLNVVSGTDPRRLSSTTRKRNEGAVLPRLMETTQRHVEGAERTAGDVFETLLAPWAGYAKEEFLGQEGAWQEGANRAVAARQRLLGGSGDGLEAELRLSSVNNATRRPLSDRLRQPATVGQGEALAVEIPQGAVAGGPATVPTPSSVQVEYPKDYLSESDAALRPETPAQDGLAKLKEYLQGFHPSTPAGQALLAFGFGALTPTEHGSIGPAGLQALATYQRAVALQEEQALNRNRLGLAAAEEAGRETRSRRSVGARLGAAEIGAQGRVDAAQLSADKAAQNREADLRKTRIVERGRNRRAAAALAKPTVSVTKHGVYVSQFDPATGGYTVRQEHVGAGRRINPGYLAEMRKKAQAIREGQGALGAGVANEIEFRVQAIEANGYNDDPEAVAKEFRNMLDSLTAQEVELPTPSNISQARQAGHTEEVIKEAVIEQLLESGKVKTRKEAEAVAEEALKE